MTQRVKNMNNTFTNFNIGNKIKNGVKVQRLFEKEINYRKHPENPNYKDQCIITSL